MSADLFNMITEQPEVSVAHIKYETAIGDLRAQVMMAPDKEMFEEQEMWCLEWQKKLTCLTTALRGLGLGVPPKDAPSFAAAHDTWKRWGAEAAVRRQEAEEREVAAREAREREEERIREEERVRVAGSSEEGEGRGPRLSITVPPRKRLHSEAFDKGGKQGEEGEEEDDLAGDKVTEATARDELRGNARRCQLKRVACSMSVKAKRDCEVSETSGTSKVKGKGKGKAHPSEPVPDTAGLSQIAGLACMAGGSNTIARPVDDVVKVEPLEYKGVSSIPNEAINTVLSLVGRLTARSSSIDAQLRAAKARLRDANVEVRDAIEGQKRYHEQLAALESQVARLVREAQACSLEDTSAFE
ncbi:hypothetical protein PAXRUDRAFT_16564 [Paxillus rubicundulus Ve08.2h10]|uniref:Uncharacterized protein n=1 Tax=Paxillus rubicundulus Ve08.2h10 TaxID=930991 RepID=A0A0D0DE04_9AGAM|nr:hypothetical protein PAXRUDRAFT_16564 [Paxillus rubicundulus Ve08.2h10]